MAKKFPTIDQEGWVYVVMVGDDEGAMVLDAYTTQAAANQARPKGKALDKYSSMEYFCTPHSWVERVRLRVQPPTVSEQLSRHGRA